MNRFWQYVEKTDGCWLWTGALHDNGYGAFHLDRRSKRAHRVAYELLKGPIPEGLTLDHLCKVITCVNPDHLEPCTRAENSRRNRKPFCKNGHARTPESRRCDICFAAKSKVKWKLWVANNKERRREYAKLWVRAKRAKERLRGDNQGRD